MQKTAIITHEKPLEVRLNEFFSEYWQGTRPAKGYAKQLLERKTDLATLLELPTPDSGWIVEEQIAPTEMTMLTMRQLAALLVNPYPINGILPNPIPELPVNINNLTIDGKNPIKIIKLLRKAPLEVQVLAYKHLIKLRACKTAPDVEAGKAPNWDIWWPKFGDYLKSFKAEIFISPDPLLLLASGIDGSKTSCHRPGGQYQYGTFAYASDEITFGAYIRSSSTKGSEYLDPHTENNCLRGRCLYWVPCIHKPAFVQGRDYFGFTSNHQRIVRDFIQGQLRAVNDLPRSTWSVSGDVESNQPSATYMDCSFLKAYWLPKHAKLPVVSIRSGLCPVCLGASMNRDGCCLSKDEPECACCGRLIDVDGYFDPNGEPLCERCYIENYATICDLCGDIWDGDGDMFDVETIHGTEKWCGHCVDRYAISCSKCGGLFSSDMIDEHAMCETCAAAREEEEENEKL